MHSLHLQKSSGVQMILGKNLYRGGMLYIYAGANPAETVRLMSVICIDSTNREVSLSVYRQALFGSRKVCIDSLLSCVYESMIQ
jgi:hypothetical protein